jgi:ribosomal-protein-alanine N-acetyltransferase
VLDINFSPFPTLTTERLILRQLNIKDADEIMILRSDDSVNEFIDRPKSIDKSEAEKFIKKIENGINNNQWIYWVITLKGDNTLIGTICYWNISVENDMAEIGYELHPYFQGKGIMQEAISKIIEFGFNKMKLKVITAVLHAGNNKSIKVLLKNNFLLDRNNEYVSKEDAGDLSVYYLKKLLLKLR